MNRTGNYGRFHSGCHQGSGRNTGNRGGCASLNEIRHNYHEQIKKCHPDVSKQVPAVSHEKTIGLQNAYDLLVSYCMNHVFSFRIEDLARDLEQNPADYWMKRFGDDPIWG